MTRKNAVNTLACFLLLGLILVPVNQAAAPTEKPRVKILYLVPKGAVPRVDMNDVIAGSLAAAQKWLQDQSGQQIRFAVSAVGKPSVTTIDMAGEDEAYVKEGAYARDRMERELRTAGILQDGIPYVAYYEGGNNDHCASALGQLAVLFLRGEPEDSLPCGDNPFAREEGKPDYWEFTLLHEIFHLLGAVDPRAPNHCHDGHVVDDNRDLMYAGSAPWNYPEAKLDVHNDDYFQLQEGEWLDVSQSVFLFPQSAKQPLVTFESKVRCDGIRPVVP